MMLIQCIRLPINPYRCSISAISNHLSLFLGCDKQLKQFVRACRGNGETANFIDPRLVHRDLESPTKVRAWAYFHPSVSYKLDQLFEYILILEARRLVSAPNSPDTFRTSFTDYYRLTRRRNSSTPNSISVSRAEFLPL